jgi:hypothetical protein
MKFGMRYTRFYTAILTGVMVLNVCKYQLPYIEYNLFKNYIVENLCVQKNEINNCCQGKCFLEKQISKVEETENNANNPDEKTTINWNGTDDYVIVKNRLQEPNIVTEIPLPFFVYIHIAKMEIDIPSPPPKRFI